VVAWNLLLHFYPYWTETAVGWDSRLQPQLSLAANAVDRSTHGDALRKLLADARDGHGNVIDSAATERRALLPLQFSLMDGRVVVTGSIVPEPVPVGSIVNALGGKPAADRLDEGMRLSSGTAQWRQARALRDMLGCTRDVGITVSLQLPAEPAREVVVPCNATQPVHETRPNAVGEVVPGIWYVDLTRVSVAQLTPTLPSLALARGIVFDMRGYPTEAGSVILRHLIETRANDRWMHVPRIVGPFGQVESWQSAGWNLQPATPQLRARRVFLTDGRAISCAESVMGYVKDRKLATIIGGPTAGTNGNIVTFPTPGGFAITFTGMRVTGHDGRAQHHMVGIAPDIRLDPTLAGVRTRRDELLERALALLQNP
jgi:Peptidase family S41